MIELVGGLKAIKRREAETDLGDRPLIVAPSWAHAEFWAHVYGAKTPRTVVSTTNLRSVEGYWPTSVLYTPRWYLVHNIVQVSNFMGRLLTRYDVPVHYAIEGV